MATDSYIVAAQEVFKQQADMLHAIGKKLDVRFTAALDALNGTGNIIVMGIGKSGHVAQRFASGLRAGGFPAFFLHPVEAAHGDAGGIGHPGDVLVVFSRSGETDELRALVRALDIPLVAITERADSWLAQQASVAVTTGPIPEAGDLQLLPTTSMTVAGVMADALALAMHARRGLTADQFAKSHPGGTLGRRLKTRVEEVMVTGTAVGRIAPGESLLSALVTAGEKRGTLAVISGEDHDRLVGVVTAGDIARYLERRGTGWQGEPVHTIMTQEPHIITADALLVKGIVRMREAGIMAMPVIVPDDGGPIVVGMLHLHDALRARVE